MADGPELAEQRATGVGDAAGAPGDAVRFLSGDGECVGTLTLPDGPGPHPVVVLVHGFAAIRAARLPAYAERFVAAGLATLVFDYRNFGDSPGEPRQLLDIERQLDDWRAAIAYVRRTPALDADRVALWGTSFSGGHVLTLAAEYRTLAAAVAQVPFAGADDRATGGVDRRQMARLAHLAARDLWAARRGRPPVEVAVVGPPGSVAVMTTPDAEPGYLALLPEGANWHNGVPARVLAGAARYRPARHADRIACPLLVQVGSADAVTPPGPAVRAALAAPKGVAQSFPVGHFDVYTGEWFERVVAAQTEFLVRHLRPGEASELSIPGGATPVTIGAKP